jgi:hypothetical protein
MFRNKWHPPALIVFSIPNLFQLDCPLRFDGDQKCHKGAAEVTAYKVSLFFRSSQII